MIPFARIMKYGNTVEPAPRVVKILCPNTQAYSAIIVLYSNGDLYGIGGGSTANYIFGNGQPTTNVSQWTLMYQNVKNVSCVDNTFIIFQTFDDKFFFCGTPGFMTGTATEANYVSVYTECTSFITATLTSAQISSIKQIEMTNSGIFILLHTGELYRSGDNSSGQMSTGNNTALTVLTYLDTNFRYITARQSSVGAIKNDNTVWLCGNNNAGQMGNGTQTNVRSIYQVPTNTGYTPIALGMNNTASFILYRNDTTFDITLWSSGNGAVGNMGDGQTAVQTTFVQNTAMSYTFSSLYSSATGNAGIGLYGSDHMMYTMGANSIGRAGNGTRTNISIVSPMSTGTDIQSPNLFDLSNRGSCYISTDGKIKFAGSWPTTNTPTASFTEIDSPK